MDVTQRSFIRIVLLSALAAATAIVAAPGDVAVTVLTFAGERAGLLPETFKAALTGRGQRGRWEVIEDASAIGGRTLAQLSADPTDYRFPLAVYSPVSAANIEVTAHFKPVAGKTDAAGGIVVRYSDANNYYVARANALEGNIRFYRVVRGSRQELATADGRVGIGEWQTLTLRAEGERFTIIFNGKSLYTATDRTFAGPGKVGIWTKADSVTYFDRFELKLLP